MKFGFVFEVHTLLFYCASEPSFFCESRLSSTGMLPTKATEMNNYLTTVRNILQRLAYSK